MSGRPQPRGDLRLGANNNAPAVIGRLKPGVTLDQANAEMIAIARNIAADNPKTNQNFTSASVTPLINAFTGVQLRQIVWAMLGAVILVLLIACVNVMNMQFGRAALRAKELAIRGALGATRWRLVRQMLTESLVVAVFGAIAGSLARLLGRGHVRQSSEGRAVSAALLVALYDRWPRARFHSRDHAHRDHRLRFAPCVSQLARQRG